MSEEKKIAIIRIRGGINAKKEIKATMTMLNLHKKHFCSVFNAKPEILGMLNKCKDYVTYGELDEGTLKLLTEKRGEKDKKFYRLSPPRKGFGRKGIKIPFRTGGALGYRGQKINDLISRMV